MSRPDVKSEGSKTSFWKRGSASGPGQIRAVEEAHTPSHRRKHSITDFDSLNSDAWDDTVDEIGFIASKFDQSSMTPKVKVHTSLPSSPSRSSLKIDDVNAAFAAASTSTVPPPSLSVDTNALPSGQSSPTRESAQKHARSPLSAVASTPTHVRSRSHDISSSSHSGSSIFSTPASQRLSMAEDSMTPHADPRIAKFKKILDQPMVDMEALRTLSWKGIPAECRPAIWQLLSGYLPANKERRTATLERKRAEYLAYVAQYYGSRTDESNKQSFHQIQIDIERTGASMKIFQEQIVREMLWRILYMWATRHPGSGYVQGINDLLVPYFIVFLSHYTGDYDYHACDVDIASISKATLDEIEADSFWCLSKLLDGIQDNYTFAQPGIQTKVRALKDLIARIDAPLQAHIQGHNVEYLQFALRWMNCLLTREIPTQCTIRLWDTYHAEVGGFAIFHLYVSAAFLTTFSKKVQDCKDFQAIIMLLQKLPTEQWGDREIELVLAEAFRLKYTFHDAQSHVTLTK